MVSLTDNIGLILVIMSGWIFCALALAVLVGAFLRFGSDSDEAPRKPRKPRVAKASRRDDEV